MTVTDCVIIGGGVIGLAIARALRKSRIEVTLFERNSKPGGEASWAAAGMLAPQSEAMSSGLFLDLCLASRKLYPNFVQELLDETGIDVELKKEGTLLPTFSGNYFEELVKKATWQKELGLEAEIISTQDINRLEPNLSTNLLGALFLPNDWQVDNRKLIQALVHSVSKLGVNIYCNAEHIELSLKSDQVVGVKIGNETLFTQIVINAAGSWAAQMPEKLSRLPASSIRPIKGQMLALEMPSSDFLKFVIRTENIYFIPRKNNRLIVGATVEDVGYTKTITASGIAKLLNSALEVIPSLANSEIIETWAGLRPIAQDCLPILGETDIKGLFCATGHYRNGILLTPITAQLILDLVLGNNPLIEIKKFSPLRLSTSKNI